MNTEMIAMTLIAHSGDARSLAFQALQAAKQNNFEEADRLMKESQEASTKAHQGQTDLLVAEANGEKPEINVLLIHSQDHLMTSMLAQEMVAEMIELYKRLEK
ncbi:PTS lactose/cellobiose transporter subunit IIA [Allobaculum stercoricanis]|uniref:PTS lactose/cellobiose transporter subunit IIA n=1 Tax=Allobaculum stercoricanis TaxID=174709 RepID=UPI00036FEF8A|nr:PTS lactose/cellobiose transporter subunit IIA [Allobaculum stercoricanis]